MILPLQRSVRDLFIHHRHRWKHTYVFLFGHTYAKVHRGMAIHVFTLSLLLELPLRTLERYPCCHPERSEGSPLSASQTLRCAQGDSKLLPESNNLSVS